jgi:uncharacterized glyoxalase superfamily protein PhnB
MNNGLKCCWCGGPGTIGIHDHGRIDHDLQFRVEGSRWLCHRSDPPGEHPTTHACVAFVSLNRETVDAIYVKALAAAGQSQSPPQAHPEYHTTCYAACVFDPEGNNNEAVHRT